MSSIPQDMLDQLIGRFNTGDEVDRHNALMSALLTVLSDSAKPSLGVKYTTYPYSLANNVYQQILPNNPKRVALIISTSANTPNTTLVLLDQGPLTPKTCTDISIISRAFPLPFYSDTNTSSQSAFIDFNVVPTNQITLISLNATTGVVIEGVLP